MSRGAEVNLKGHGNFAVGKPDLGGLRVATLPSTFGGQKFEETQGGLLVPALLNGRVNGGGIRKESENRLGAPSFRLVWTDDFSGTEGLARPDGRSTQQCLNTFKRICKENDVEPLDPLYVTSNIYGLRPESASYLVDYAVRDTLKTHGEDTKLVVVTVCDPGVGGAREAVVVETNFGYWIGPNNGDISELARRYGVKLDEDGRPKVLKVEENIMKSTKTATFHGDDLFAPLAALIASGKDPSEINVAQLITGKHLSKSEVVKLTAGEDPSQVKVLEKFDGELKIVPFKQNQVLDLDHFRFMRINTLYPEGDYTHAKVTVTDRDTEEQKATIVPLARTFVDGEKGDLLIYEGSDDYLEIAASDSVHWYEPHAIKQLSVHYEEAPIEPGDVFAIEWLNGNYGKGGEVVGQEASGTYIVKSRQRRGNQSGELTQGKQLVLAGERV